MRESAIYNLNNSSFVSGGRIHGKWFQQSQCNQGSYSLALTTPSKLELACLDNPTHWFAAYS